ncbi:MAG: hypothetical protein WKG01_39490 [Kofleriaceae bacterium]
MTGTDSVLVISSGAASRRWGLDSATSIDPDDPAGMAGTWGLEIATSIEPDAPGGTSVLELTGVLVGAESRARFADRRALFDLWPPFGSSGTPVDGFVTGSSIASGVAEGSSGELGESGLDGDDTVNHDMEKKRATRFSATSRR